MGILKHLWMAHIPVLVNEVLELLKPKDEERVLDCTFGGGGHTKAILNSANCSVCAIDRDPDAKERASELKLKYQGRFDFKLDKFSNLPNVFGESKKFDAVLFDLGISSFQIDNSERGFSFSKDARLDMRMSKEGISAYDVVNTFSEKDLADILWTYGDETRSRKIAFEIISSRKLKPIETTIQLANIVRKATNSSFVMKKYSKVDVATKTFQAIRIFVNDELREISIALENLPKILNDKARIALISFHSLEDRLVKNWAKSKRTSIIPINSSVIKPNSDEISLNPRARSAILRGFWYDKHGSRCEESGGKIE